MNSPPIPSSLRHRDADPTVLADRSGVITYVNQRFMECYGWSAKIVGTSLTRIIPAHFHDSHNMGFSRFLVTGRSRIANHPMEAPVRRGDGRLALAEHLIVVEKIQGEWVIGASLKPRDLHSTLPDSCFSGAAGPAVATLDEVRTTMGKMEIALGEVEDAIVWTDPHGIVNWCNAAFDRLTRRPHMDIIGARITEILPLKSEGRPVGPHAHPLARALGNDCRHTEYELDRPGPPVVLEINGAQFLLTAAERAVILAMRDMSRRKQMEASLRASRRRMEDELNVAHEIQMNLMPRRFPEGPEFRLHAAIHPAREVGGDFYDVYFIDPEQLCICVGDVSGKGVPAALFMALAKTLVRDRAEGRMALVDVVRQVNRTISNDNPSHMFVSLFLAVLEIPTGKLTYVNAGHNPPLLRRMDGVLQKMDSPHGPVLGASEHSRYADASVMLGGGDIVLLYTDGLTEAMNAKGELFSEKRLTRLVSQQPPSPQDLTRSVLQAVNTFQNGTPPSDDITLLALEYRRYPLAYDI